MPNSIWKQQSFGTSSNITVSDDCSRPTKPSSLVPIVTIHFEHPLVAQLHKATASGLAQKSSWTYWGSLAFSMTTFNHVSHMLCQPHAMWTRLMQTETYILLSMK